MLESDVEMQFGESNTFCLYFKNDFKFQYMTHQSLRVQLFRTLGATLVEASPTDDYWGVGMSIGD